MIERKYIETDDKEKIKQLRNLSCLDALNFQNNLLKVRKFDDKIINILNDEIPTESFLQKGFDPTNKCTQLQKEFHDYYDSREAAIKNCLEHAKTELEKLKESKTDSPMALREKNQNLRIFRQELAIEKIHRDRSLKALDEKCKNYF